ncbi:GNAT family N-acetyltransferase [Zooshikella marina]|uniref:GNAT family N-acetyltransferase n=1 Tax=Zooshikella ganghwensis TaxID=202772 RepID=UPI001BAEEEFB|nr:GNAT family N-acetyltransferase [Zooshikella ganghwensis]MBU2704976.1 GNAT family N-acetyltransferase [Zooshikella ganghwensis]
MKEYELIIVEGKDQIELCFDAFKELRPQIEKKQFVEQVLRQRKQSYQIVAIKIGDKVPCAAGFRFAEFLAWGKVLYIDDLTTLPEYRKRGYAAILMDWLIEYAQSQKCDGLHLDTGHQRHSAHKLYLKKGLNINSHHLSIEF